MANLHPAGPSTTRLVLGKMEHEMVPIRKYWNDSAIFHTYFRLFFQFLLILLIRGEFFFGGALAI